jgi:hypothetical protein
MKPLSTGVLLRDILSLMLRNRIIARSNEKISEFHLGV